MTTKAQKQAERDEALGYLRESIKAGDTLFTILRHRAPSGMSRAIDVVQITGETYRGRAVVLRHTWNACKATGTAYSRAHEAATLQGAGMDFGFAFVYNISSAMFPDGFGCIGRDCPSNDHSNGDRDYAPHGIFDENGSPENREPGIGEAADGCRNHWHHSGGYALRQEWL